MVRRSCATSARTLARSPALARQEAVEAEPVDRQARDGERHEDRARPGDARHAYARLHRSGDEAVAGVGDGRHTGVGDDDDALPRDEAGDEVRACGRPRCARGS